VAEFFQTTGNVLLDRSPDEMIAAVIVALAFSLVMAGLVAFRRKSIRENLMPIVVVMLVANLASMAVAAGYVAFARKNSTRTMRGSHFGEMTGDESIWVEGIFRAADLNRDGRLSHEEAALAADDFIRNADPSGRGAIDPRALGHVLMIKEHHLRAWVRPSDNSPAPRALDIHGRASAHQASEDSSAGGALDAKDGALTNSVHTPTEPVP
jgi:hypothetical protein